MNRSFVHLELNTDDTAAAKEFYETLFGWAYQDIPIGDNVYTGVTSAVAPGAAMQMRPKGAQTGWLPYIGVDDVEVALEVAEEAGAKIIHPFTEVPHFGYFAIISDPTGAQLGLWQPAEDEDVAAQTAVTAIVGDKKRPKKKAAKKKSTKKKTATRAAAVEMPDEELEEPEMVAQGTKAAAKKKTGKKAGKKTAKRATAVDFAEDVVEEPDVAPKGAKKKGKKKAGKKTAKKAAAASAEEAPAPPAKKASKKKGAASKKTSKTGGATKKASKKKGAKKGTTTRRGREG